MIRAGIGGWVFEPWRGAFFPEGLPQAKELAHASRAVTSIEINSTFYSSQKPATFRKWAEETPEDFVFSVKASRYAVTRKDLGTAGESIERFVNGGVGELGKRLGPILWQLAPTKKYAKDEIDAFLELLPKKLGARPLRHALEVRHASFADAAFIKQMRKHNAAIVMVSSEKHHLIADPTADFVYARLEDANEDEPAGYPRATLALWARRAQTWAQGGAPDDLPAVAPAAKRAGKRDVFVYFISGAKVRNPAAAIAFLKAVVR